MRVVDDDDKPVAWDGEAFGELLVRGPSVVEEYYDRPEADATDFVAADDGGARWLRTGDIATVDEDGYMEVVDRVKDVIKSGRRVDLQHRVGERLDGPRGRRRGGRDRGVPRALAGAPAGVRRAEGGPRARRRGIRTFLADEFPRWWLPDDVRFREEIPKTATGKFDKKTLRGDRRRSRSAVRAGRGGWRMTEDTTLTPDDSLPDLTGRVAVVTGGGRGSDER